jgi:hypothetical protein
MARCRFGDDERRARIGSRHRLARGTQASTLAEAASSLVVLHSTDPAGLFLEAWARMAASSPNSIEWELYDDRSVLRILAMRRTLFLAPLEDVAIINAAASRAIAETERKRTLKMMADAGIGPDPAGLLARLETDALAAIRERGEMTTTELRRSHERFGAKITLARGKSYEGTISLASKVVFHLALDGRIGRGRPLGTWIGGQFRWSPIERWFPDGIPDLAVDHARAELVRRWLKAFGPASRDDVRWWTGWTVGATRQALEAIGAVEVGLAANEVGYALADDLEPTETPDHWVALLPALDATTMGWTRRDWYLGPHRTALFDTSGNAGPTIWVDGRVVGGWAQRRTGEIVPWLLEDVGMETRRLIDAEAARLEAWLGPTRLNWGFPTPLELGLRA